MVVDKKYTGWRTVYGHFLENINVLHVFVYWMAAFSPKIYEFSPEACLFSFLGSANEGIFSSVAILFHLLQVHA